MQSKLARVGLCTIPEGRSVFPNLTVEENLRLGAFIRNNNTEYRQDLKDIFGLFPILEERFKIVKLDAEEVRIERPVTNPRSLRDPQLRNRRSVVMDLKKPDAVEVLLGLVETADVIIEAYRPGALEKMGLGSEQIKAVNPRIVYVGAYGYGEGGRYAGQPAYDDLIQGMAALPAIFTGLRLAVGAGWLTVVTAEMLAVKSGLGYMILNGQLTFRSDLIIAGIIVIGGIGLLADQLVRLVRARVCRWQEGLTASPI